MKCNKCKSNEASIHVANVGDFCLNCHNEIMADLLGINKLDEFSNIITIHDVDGIVHRFEISNIIMPGFSVWKAEEMEGGYQFEVLVKHEENPAVAVEQFHQKILTGLGYKTLTHMSDRYFVDNAIHIDKEQYSLNSVGTCRIQHSEEENTVCLVIDGKNISLHDFGRALTAFEGFNMDFQIRDLSEEVLGKNTTLRPVSIHPDVIIEHFERTLGWFLERDFLSYKRASACVEALVERVDELELLYKCGSRDEAVEVGKRMKKRLISIDNDTDDFPDYLLGLIDRVIEIAE